MGTWRCKAASACLLGVILGGAAWTGAAQAHHSFAVFFSGDNEAVSLRGTVKSFRFTNPHGGIELVVGRGEAQKSWLVETNSPSILIRRGWSKDSMKPGDEVIIVGWPARDGSNFMRLKSAARADGTPIGSAPSPQADKP